MPDTELIDLVPDYVRDFEPYRPTRPDSELCRFYGVDRIIRLHNNENLLGPPLAVQRMLAGYQAHDVAWYPNGDSWSLREILARKHGKDPEQFLVGNGSCELIGCTVKTFCQKGDNIVTADKTFAAYEWAATKAGVEVRMAPLHCGRYEAHALLAAVNRRTRVIFLCNPNNPTGSYWNLATLEAFLDALGQRVLVVLDEAYAEFVAEPDYPDGLALLDRRPNVVVFRTFSKMYGLAGLRVGYLCGTADVVDQLRRIAIIYSVNRPAQACAAAALQDDAAHIENTRAMVSRARRRLEAFFAELDLPVLSGQGNFIMARTPLPDTLLARRLLTRGVLIRTMTDFRFPNWIRITLAPDALLDPFEAALREALRP